MEILLEKYLFDNYISKFLLEDNPNIYLSYTLEYTKKILKPDFKNISIHLKNRYFFSYAHAENLWIINLLISLKKNHFYDEEFFLNCLDSDIEEIKLNALNCLEYFYKYWNTKVIVKLKKLYIKESKSSIRSTIGKLISLKSSISLEKKVFDIYESLIVEDSDLVILNSSILGSAYFGKSNLFLSENSILYLLLGEFCNEEVIYISDSSGVPLGFINDVDKDLIKTYINTNKKIYAVFSNLKYSETEIKIMIKSDSKNNILLISSKKTNNIRKF